MKVKKSDVLVCDMLLVVDEKDNYSYWDEEVHDPNDEFKPPNYTVGESSVVVIRIADDKYIRPQDIKGLFDFLALKNKIKKRIPDPRIINNCRYNVDDKFVGNLRPKFKTDGLIDLKVLQEFISSDRKDCLI